MRFFAEPLPTVRLIMVLLCGLGVLNLGGRLWGVPTELEGLHMRPIVTKREAPTYPFLLRRNGIPGGAYVRFIVTKTGKVAGAHAVAQTNVVFGKEAVDAVAKWEFAPGLKKGQPVDARLIVPIIFQMRGDEDAQLIKIKRALSGFALKSQPQTPEGFRYDKAPRLNVAVAPVWPWVDGVPSRRGEADLVFIVDVQGRVAQVKVVSSTSEAFGQAARAALECWTYTPATLAGEPTFAIGRKIIKFDLYRSKKSPQLRLLREIKRGKTHFAKGDELDEPLKPSVSIQSRFPLALEGKQSHGTAMVECIVASDGSVCLPRIIEASEEAFGWAASTAVATWRFEPPRVHGKPVDVRVRIPFDFKQ